MPDIAPVKGLIELTDNYSSQLDLARAALSNFSKENQESLTAVAGASGIVLAAFAAINVAALELGKRGSDVKNVDDTLEHFTGSAENAAKVLDALRTGTKGTIDDFTLAKDAAHLLSAGVKLTADDFNTLGSAAFVLKSRGLGGTKEQLDLVSEALVTGRTRALAMAVGVVDTGDAEERYAAKLGVTKDQLSLTGQAEAKRLAVMEILNKAVKDAGTQELTFADQIEKARTRATNFIDELSKAVAQSPVFAAGMKTVGDAFNAAFGSDNTELVQTVVHWLEQAAIMSVNFGLAAVEMTRVVYASWSTIKTVILGVETAIIGIVDGVVEALTQITRAAEAVHVVPAGSTAQVTSLRTELRAMTADLAAQTLEAKKGADGTSDFDQKLDALGGTLMNVKDAMTAASTETSKNSDAQVIAAKNTATLKRTQDELNQSMLDQGKITAALVKSTHELNTIWEDYFALVSKDSKTSGDAQRDQIEATFNKQVQALDDLDPLYSAKYNAYRQIANESLSAIETDWDSVKDKSIEGLQQQATKALETYDRMSTSGLHFSREVLEEQLQKYKDLQAAANGWGNTAAQAVQQVTEKIKVLDSAWVTNAEVAAATISKTTVMVKTLSGELISLADAQKRQQMGGSFDVTSANFDQALFQLIHPAIGVSRTQYRDPYALAKGGYSLEEIMKYGFDQNQQGPLPPPQGPRIPGFAAGGTVMLGEHGPEVVRVPLGSTVFPTGTTPDQFGGGGGGSTTHNYYVNGTATEVAQKIKKIMMRDLNMRKQFS